ncbi:MULTISPECIES: LuxR C-terminal-related transcriptional regulator [Burkholderia]|uniref:LuxR family transcriptional regulator n=1 Tax=Burkholderia aenigmatica TaxID=2015348 RepID=A0ABY6XRL7_9BURK|nr:MULTISPECIES: LuxR C-terminal-related transcriptional regulator [Burkholderia]VWC68132.1 LuxR family transcriptional regulator [Burkholderia aenigmatica]VWC92716.1 LuxR family transcriptional regulator [Burkholderia aenigmatica]
MLPVIATRLRPPTRAGAAVPREVLPTALEHLRSRRLLLVRAPAGYGKSLLMAQLHDALRAGGEAAVGWISVGEIGASLAEVAMHCASALSRIVPGLDSAMQTLFEAQRNVSPETIGAMLCNELERADGDGFLFVDDLHAIAGTPGEHLYECLLRDAPERMHFAIASRTEPGFSVARLRARGELGELDSTTLRFSVQEAHQFFKSSNASPPSDRLVELACEKTEGWAAGLQLVSLSVGNGNNWDERLHGLSGSNRSVGSFLADDVFSAQSEEVQRFLLESSVLRQFCYTLCDEVGQRDDSRAIIKQLQRQGLFIFSLDEEENWYRYHHLFSQFLKKRLSESSQTRLYALHRRAAHWFCSNGMLDDAMFHAVSSGDFRYAASILDDACNDLFYQGKLLSLMAWVKQIPECVLNEYPTTQLIRAWNLTLEWRFDEAGCVLNSVLKCIRESVEKDSLAPEAATRLYQIYQHRKMMLAHFADDMRTVERMCSDLLVDFPDDDPYLRGSVELCLLCAQRELYHLDAVDRLDMAARSFFKRANSQFVLVWHESILGPALIQRGDVAKAASGYRSAIDIAHGIAGHASPLGAMPAVMLAELLMDCGEYDAARSQWDQYLPLCNELGLVDHLIAAYVGRARLASVYQENETAESLLAHASRFASAKSFDRLFWNATAERIRRAVQSNDVDSAQRIANEAKLPRDAASLYPSDQTTTKTEAMAIAWIRLALARGFAKEAEALAKRWIAFALPRSCLRTEIRMRILVAASKLASADTRGAKRALIDALAHAAPRKIVLPFLEEGDAVKQALAAIFNIPESIQSDVEFSGALLQAYAAGPESVLLRPSAAGQQAAALPPTTEGRLSQREISILEFVSQGLQNKEIADRLGLAEGSVKWYMQQIYAKLGVRRRLNAYQRAKALGLIR